MLAALAARPAPWLQLICFRPRGQPLLAFEDRVREAVAAVGGYVRFRAAPFMDSRRAGVFVSARLPTLVAVVDGRVMGQAIGELPAHELANMLVAALR
jgi:hypothetical protein